ncbi:hypothetical protein E0K83_03795 [Gramella sp. BOM4]|nr:hypothetical protein [Christiangramia bathymodioli]
MSTKQRCPHGKSDSCPDCSKVKMVAYLMNDHKIVWYSFFKEDKRYGRVEMISGVMGSRLEKKHGKDVKKMMFFDNLASEKPMIGES